jgi:hypothetical protein
VKIVTPFGTLPPVLRSPVFKGLEKISRKIYEYSGVRSQNIDFIEGAVFESPELGGRVKEFAVGIGRG